MDIDWSAVAVGFVVSLALGLVGGVVVPFTDVSLPALSWVVTGLVAGVAAGYVAGGDWNRGAIHGGLSVVVGALVVTLVLGFLGILFTGIFGLSVLLVSLVALALYAIPGAVGGAVGAAIKRRSRAREVTQPAG